MSDFQEKLNQILSSPEEMDKIMGMARTLSGSLGQSGDDGDVPAAATGGGGLPNLSGLTSMLGSVDPKIVGLVSRAIGEYSSGRSDKSALISAMKPYVKPDRRDKLDQAADIAKLVRIARLVLSELPGGDDSGNV